MDPALVLTGLIVLVAFRAYATGALDDPAALRILVKSVTWRAVGTTQVILLARVLSGSWDKAFAIGIPDTVIKFALGVMHERLWETEQLRAVQYRRAWKTATWKVFAISSTVLVATLYGNYSFAIKLGPIDTVFKSLNYYGHELLWDRVSWGTPARATSMKSGDKSKPS